MSESRRVKGEERKARRSPFPVLSEKGRAVLEGIADGQSYQQIVDRGEGITYRDIFDAAREAIRIADTAPAIPDHVALARVHYPRAYEPWEPGEEADLARRLALGQSAREIAAGLGRRSGAVETRIRRLGLE